MAILDRLKSLFSGSKPEAEEPLKQTGRMHQTGSHRVTNQVIRKQAVPRRQPETVDPSDDLKPRIEEQGPNKNVLIRNKYVREETGTHETLKILDDSMLEDDDEAGIDPYNTGQFDRSKNWDKRFRKN